MKDSYARDSLNSLRRMSRFSLLVLDAPCTERYARCGERTGVNHPLLLDFFQLRNRLSFLVFRRGNAVVLSECTRKAKLIRIPYRPCHLSRTHMLVKKHRSRILHPAANQVLLRRTSHLFIDPAKTSFILKHQAYFWSTRFLHWTSDSADLHDG